MAIEKVVANASDCIFNIDDVFWLVDKACAYYFKEARLSTKWGSDIEDNKYLGQASTVMRASRSKDGDLLSHLDKIRESEDGINNTSLKHLLINNHEIAAHWGKKGHLSLELIFEFWKNISKNFQTFKISSNFQNC